MASRFIRGKHAGWNCYFVVGVPAFFRSLDLGIGHPLYRLYVARVMFTRSDKGSKKGQIEDLERVNDTRPMLPPPLWVESLRQEIRSMGDIIRLREALAVSHRDIERFRIERDRLLRTLVAEKDKVRELEIVIQNQMRSKI